MKLQGMHLTDVRLWLLGSEMLLWAFLQSAGDELNGEGEGDKEHRWRGLVSSSVTLHAMSSPGCVSLSSAEYLEESSTVSLGMVNCGMLSGVTTMLRKLSRLAQLSDPTEHMNPRKAAALLRRRKDKSETSDPLSAEELSALAVMNPALILRAAGMLTATHSETERKESC